MALAVAAVILIGGGADKEQRNGAAPAGQTSLENGKSPSTGADPEEKDRVSEAPPGDEKLGTPALGDKGAPVVMVEFSDYQ